MNEEKFNIEVRKFLKKVGINSQREIEQAVRAAIASGALKGDESLTVTATLEIGDLSLSERIDGRINLE
ncbi:MAG: DUF6494 family protein [Gammaproteobacteria bacterium]|jgi:hypothetical protein|nr:DUF6494 family protein [Gammaproteobacteria bacterium]